jgi:thiamine biosynthesis lipoprotein
MTLLLSGRLGLPPAGAGWPPPHPHKQARYVMGTLCEITAYAPVDGEARTEEAIEAAVAELKRIDAALSNWKPDSQLMRMNAVAAAAPAAGRRPQAAVGQELFERVRTALQLARETHGRFDPTVGPLVRAWGFLPPGTHPLPRDAAIAAARERVGWQKVILNAETRTVQFAVPNMEIDLGGIAKGYAAQSTARVLREHGIRAALVNLGSSSMAAIGSPPGESGWPVVIRDPRDTETPVMQVLLQDGESLATSGTYEKTTGRGRNRHSHILNPATGAAVGGAVSVTILMDDAETADALTKPFFLMPRPPAEDWAKLLARFPKASVILMAARGERLQRRTGGLHPERFLALEGASERRHAAQTH